MLRHPSASALSKDMPSAAEGEATPCCTFDVIVMLVHHDAFPDPMKLLPCPECDHRKWAWVSPFLKCLMLVVKFSVKEHTTTMAASAVLFTEPHNPHHALTLLSRPFICPSQCFAQGGHAIVFGMMASPRANESPAGHQFFLMSLVLLKTLCKSWSIGRSGLICM